MNMRENYIKVWRFDEAPQELQDLSEHGGDEDYLMLVPASWKSWWPDANIHLAGSAFGCCSVSTHKLTDGSIVYIGAHA